jgi:hypothetical protein
MSVLTGRLADSSSIKAVSFSSAHNETLSVVAMRVSNEDCSPETIHGRNAAPTPTGFAQIVIDHFPVLHWITSIFITG